MDPLVFEPFARPQVWGNRKLETILGKRLPAEGNFGESWEISAHPHHVSRVADGPFRGTPLDELWRAQSAEIIGQQSSANNRFPLLIKYLDCHQQLSVQVHPTDQVAAELIPGELGKTEAWVVISTEPTARIYAGLKPGVTEQTLRTVLEQGTVAELLHSFVPEPGDCLFLPAGTVHAVGGGVLMAEVQQSSDATFRLFDWNRLGSDGKPRELHIEKSLRAINWSAGPANPIVPKAIRTNADDVTGEQLIECPYFAMARYSVTGRWTILQPERMSIWLVLSGSAELTVEKTRYRRSFQIGETVLIPANSRAEWASAGAVLLHVTT